MLRRWQFWVVVGVLAFMGFCLIKYYVSYKMPPQAPVSASVSASETPAVLATETEAVTQQVPTVPIRTLTKPSKTKVKHVGYWRVVRIMKNTFILNGHIRDLAIFVNDNSESVVAICEDPGWRSPNPPGPESRRRRPPRLLTTRHGRRSGPPSRP